MRRSEMRSEEKRTERGIAVSRIGEKTKRIRLEREQVRKREKKKNKQWGRKKMIQIKMLLSGWEINVSILACLTLLR